MRGWANSRRNGWSGGPAAPPSGAILLQIPCRSSKRVQRRRPCHGRADRIPPAAHAGAAENCMPLAGRVSLTLGPSDAAREEDRHGHA